MAAVRKHVEQWSGQRAQVIALPYLPDDHHPGYELAKRTFDLAVVCAALIAAIPLMILIAVAIFLDGGRPIVYRQQRVGRFGRRFDIYKFRTMRQDQRGTGNDRRKGSRPGSVDRRQTLKTEHDPRITRVGRLLRQLSLDELPQLFNILRGEMSFVGPRPEQVAMLRFYRREHYQRHRVLPGLTGWWQIHGRSERADGAHPEDDLRQKLADDLYYIDHRSFWLDVRIFLMTVPVLLLRRGAF